MGKFLQTVNQPIAVQRRLMVVVKASYTRSHIQRARERVLRYPDGRERVIRYPVLETVDEELTDASSSLWSSRTSAAVEEIANIPTDGGSSPQAAAQTLDQQMQFLESLFAASSSAYEAQAPDRQQLTSTSYEILEHCPWVLPRKLFVLVKQTPGSTTGNMFSLRTKMTQPGVSSDLARVLGRGHSADFLDVSEMRDGVLAFERDASAMAFADALELETFAQVSVVEMDSHYLFRNTSEAQALVVLLPAHDFVPRPHELSSALKSQRPWDEL